MTELRPGTSPPPVRIPMRRGAMHHCSFTGVAFASYWVSLLSEIQPARNFRPQRYLGNGLGEESLHAMPLALLADFVGVVGGQRQDGNVCVAGKLANGCGGFESVDL